MNINNHYKTKQRLVISLGLDMDPRKYGDRDSADSHLTRERNNSSMSFACSRHVRAGSIQVHRVPPSVQMLVGGLATLKCPEVL